VKRPTVDTLMRSLVLSKDTTGRWDQFWNWLVKGLGGMANMIEQLYEQSVPHADAQITMRDCGERILKYSGQRYVLSESGIVTDNQTNCQRQFDPSILFKE